MKETFEGGCDCGAVRYQARGPLRDVTNCHCGQCRRTHGHFAAYTNADRDGLSFIEDRGLKWYKSSDFARRGFCGECGASIFWEAQTSDQIGIAAGTLNGPTGLKTVAEIFVADQPDYYRLDPDLPHFQQGE